MRLYVEQASNKLVGTLSETCKAQLQELEALRGNMATRQEASLQRHRQHCAELQQQVTNLELWSLPPGMQVSRADLLEATKHQVQHMTRLSILCLLQHFHTLN